MRVRDLGEFELIASIEKLAASDSPAVVLGIGDDAALLSLPRGRQLATSVDAYVEGVHFRLDQESPRRVGERSLLAALSDLAAMGAEPLGATLAASLPPSLEVRTARELGRGVVLAGKRNACPLVGGNMTRAREVSLTVSVFGSIEKGRAMRRDAARVGHRIFVTGQLGSVHLARQRLHRGERARVPLPVPRLGPGRELSALRGIGACIDLSDGLLADLGHLLSASGVGAELDWEALPRPRSLAARCRLLGLPVEQPLLAGGEDYELLFTGGRGFPGPAELSARLGVKVSEIGRVVSAGLRWSDGITRKAAGWRHF